MSAIGGRRKPPKQGKNSDFGPNLDFSLSYGWRVSGGGYFSPGTLSEYYLIPTLSTRHTEIPEKIALRIGKSQSKSTDFGFRPGIYYRVLW